MKISIVIPCYNEASTVGIIAEKAQKAALPAGLDREIIIVDDGSIDGSPEIIKALAVKYKNIKVSFHDKNYGKGKALSTGFREAAGDMIIIQDADLEYDPSEYEKLAAPIVNGTADVVLGTRFISADIRRVLFFRHYLANKLLTFLCNIFSNLNLSDIEVGYKVFRKSVLDRLNLREKGFGIEPELVLKTARLKCRIYEVGISYRGRTYEEGKKIRWHDALKAVVVILKYGLFRIS